MPTPPDPKNATADTSLMLYAERENDNQAAGVKGIQITHHFGL